MTRIELLSLADFVAKFSGTDYDRWAADLRKIAELRPVAWCLGIPQYAHSSNIIAANEFTPDAEHRDEWAALYQLSEVLTDE